MMEMITIMNQPYLDRIAAQVVEQIEQFTHGETNEELELVTNYGTPLETAIHDYFIGIIDWTGHPRTLVLTPNRSGTNGKVEFDKDTDNARVILTHSKLESSVWLPLNVSEFLKDFFHL